MEAGVTRIATDRAHFETLKATPEKTANKKDEKED